VGVVGFLVPRRHLNHQRRLNKLNSFLMEWDELIYNEAPIPLVQPIKLSITCSSVSLKVRMLKPRIMTSHHALKTEYIHSKGAECIKLDPLDTIEF